MAASPRPRFLAPAITAMLLLSAAFASAASVTLESAGMRWDAYGNLMHTFRLSNRSDEAILFSGYSQSDPLYQVELQENGQWKENTMLWCGTGLDLQQLPSGKSFTFTVSADSSDKLWRVSVDFTTATSGEVSKLDKTAWSEAISVQARQRDKDLAPDASSLVKREVSWDPESVEQYTFKLTNHSEKALYYGGFSEADVPPIYYSQKRHGGRWIDRGKANWSGSEFGFKPLAPGKSIAFTIPAPSLDRPWRIGIRLYRTNKPNAVADAFRLLWWPERPPRGTRPTQLVEADQ